MPSAHYSRGRRSTTLILRLCTENTCPFLSFCLRPPISASPFCSVLHRFPTSWPPYSAYLSFNARCILPPFILLFSLSRLRILSRYPTWFIHALTCTRLFFSLSFFFPLSFSFSLFHLLSCPMIHVANHSSSSLDLVTHRILLWVPLFLFRYFLLLASPALYALYGLQNPRDPPA